MSVNKAIIVGNLGKDPEPIASGKGCKFSVATNEKWKDKNGNFQEKAEWHQITCWGKTSENCVKYLSKGRQVYLEGRIETDEYEKDGEKRYSTGITAFNVTFLSGGEPAGGGSSRSGSNGGRKQRKKRAPAPAQSSGSGWDDDDDWGVEDNFDQPFDDDDIPF